MSLERDDPNLAAALQSLAPYLASALTRAGLEAARLFADEVSREHLIGVLLGDEEAALHQLVLHAFADPETIALDVLALTPGILVVANDATLPFSPQGVAAVHRARAAARAAGRAEVTEAQLLAGAVEVLPQDMQEALASAGLDREALARVAAASGKAGELDLDQNLFHAFDPPSRRAVSRAARAAVGADEPSIGPARLALSALAAAELEQEVGLTRSRAAIVLQGQTADPSPPPDAPPRLGPELLAFLRELPPRAGSLEILSLLHQDPRSELTQAFTRQKVSPELLAHARGSFSDPAS